MQNRESVWVGDYFGSRIARLLDEPNGGDEWKEGVENGTNVFGLSTRESGSNIFWNTEEQSGCGWEPSDLSWAPRGTFLPDINCMVSFPTPLLQLSNTSKVFYIQFNSDINYLELASNPTRLRVQSHKTALIPEAICKYQVTHSYA